MERSRTRTWCRGYPTPTGSPYRAPASRTLRRDRSSSPCSPAQEAGRRGRSLWAGSGRIRSGRARPSRSHWTGTAPMWYACSAPTGRWSVPSPTRAAARESCRSFGTEPMTAVGRSAPESICSSFGLKGECACRRRYSCDERVHEPLVYLEVPGPEHLPTIWKVYLDAPDYFEALTGSSDFDPGDIEMMYE